MFESLGWKRKAVTFFAFLLDITRLFPGAGEAVAFLDQVNGWLGLTAVTHAGAQGTLLSKEKVAGVVAVIYFLIALSTWIPALVPVLPVLYKAASTLAVARLGLAFAK